ncbi:MAG: bifunctional DNA-formamidopyrimidine glycosylase/DNA-(apurinic or apyrimidinic site) lyase [Gemmatimonadaceae bacterium]|nr:bifunctional DNA-formamidopyrimidine glycosylase/DNA-(apurinic or apyrimidinic site) lyase [Gemmatimonadaceae bacterium]
MPELPEVETIARELDARLAGRIVVEVAVRRADVLRGEHRERMGEILRGDRLRRAWRRAKTAVLSFDRGWHLLVTPRFTGAVLVFEGGRAAAPPGETAGPPEDDPYAALVWRLADGGAFWYRDVRRLGTVTLVDDEALDEFDRSLGPEPLDPSFDADRLSVLLRGSRSAIKKVLMDQRVLAGVGNIYANEALWRARIDPSREARSLVAVEVERLHAELRSILTASIAVRGTTFRDYRDPSNRAGGFAAQLQAYGRGGERCKCCGATLTETHAIDGRSTVFCHRCQH